MLTSRNVLIVEDEPLISMMLEDFLEALGHRAVATAETVKDALAAVEAGGFDLAVLDVNLKGESVWPVAKRLSEQGITFVLASGGHVDPPPPEFDDVVMLEKPYTLDRISKVISETTASA